MTSLRDLDHAKPVYQVPHDDVVREVMVPAMAAAARVRCMVGYFDSGAFRTLAPGIAAFIENSSQPLCFLASPVLPREDQDAIREAIANPEEVVERVLRTLFEDARMSEDALVRHHYQCLAYLLARERLEMRIVLMRREGTFHPKVWE